MLASSTLLAAGEAAAHPHVWVTMKSDLVYADGRIVGVRHKWTFDDMFSTYATQGLDTNNDGKLSREELSSLAEVNITSMKDFDYFTRATLNGKAAKFDTPKDYWLEHHDSLLTLTFTLPLAQPSAVARFELDIYDPAYFVSFEFDQKDAVAMVGAPAKCEASIVRPGDAAKSATKRLSESFFTSQAASAEYGAAFANKVSVKCP